MDLKIQYNFYYVNGCCQIYPRRGTYYFPDSIRVVIKRGCVTHLPSKCSENITRTNVFRTTFLHTTGHICYATTYSTHGLNIMQHSIINTIYTCFSLSVHVYTLPVQHLYICVYQNIHYVRNPSCCA